MATITEKYLGGLRVECVHERSGVKLVTDAPVDNNGKGESFSPTDLCATALGACAMTLMGIQARDNNLDLVGTRLEVTKVMGQDPRKIAKIQIIFHMPERPFSDAEKALLEKAAWTCPMALTLGNQVEQEFVFKWA